MKNVLQIDTIPSRSEFAIGVASDEMAAARVRIEDAARTLQVALAAIEGGGARADKRTVSAAVGAALQQLGEAKAVLDSLEGDQWCRSKR